MKVFMGLVCLKNFQGLFGHTPFGKDCEVSYVTSVSVKNLLLLAVAFSTGILFSYKIITNRLA